MTTGEDGLPPDPPSKGTDAVKAAMSKKQRVTATEGLRVIEGGKVAAPAKGRPKRASKPKAAAKDGEPYELYGAGERKPVDDDDGGDRNEADEPLSNDQPESEFDRRPPGMDDFTWEAAKHCAELDQNDRHNGHRLLVWFGQDLGYVPGMGWLTFRGTHWQRDEGELGARLLAQDIVDKIKLECFHVHATPAQQRVVEAARALRKIKDLTPLQQATINRADKIVEQLSVRRTKRRAFAVTTGNAGRTSAMLVQAASLKAIDQDVLDADHYAFNVKNGTLHFSRGPDLEQDLTPEADGTPIAQRMIGQVRFLPHDRAEMITKLADVDYDPEATCPKFQAFLDRTQPKQNMQLFLQVFHGYAMMIGGNGVQKLAYHYGLGANGKSAFIEATGRLAGSYRSVVSPDTLTGDGQRQGQQASPDIARLFNTRYVTVEELPKGVPLKEDLVKAVSGGTKLTARFLQKDIFEFLPIFTAVLSGNHKPTISGADWGIWRRVLLVHWAETITDAEKIEFDDLMAIFDAERPGILNWLIEGVLLYLGKGLQPFIPPEVTAFTQEYRKERDNVGMFAEAMISRVQGESVQAGPLYKAYQDWCEVNGLAVAKQTSFGNRLGELGFEKITGRIYVYQNIRLAPSPKYDPTVPSPRERDGDPGWSPGDI